MSGTKSSAIKHGTLTGYQHSIVAVTCAKKHAAPTTAIARKRTAPWRITQRWARGALVSAIMSQKPWICPFGR